MTTCSIQIFRAIAIIAVVMIHTTPAGQWQIFCKPFINFAVATFIFLSGYLTKISNDNWLQFYTKRIARVLVPYVLWTVIYSIPEIKATGLSALIKNLLCANATTTLYYIFVYIQFVLLTPLLGKLAKSPYRCLGWLTFYYLGLILGNKLISPKFNLRTIVILYCFSLLLQMAEGYLWYTVDPAGCGSQLKLTSLLSSSVFMLIIYCVLRNSNDEPKSQLLSTIGDFSFGIYLIHMMILNWLETLKFYTGIPYPINSFLVLSISFIFCSISSVALGKEASRWVGLA